MDAQNQTRNYLIEHFETELSEWTLKEYTHMLMIVSKLHDSDASESRLILTNFPYVEKLRQGTLEEDALKTLKHTNLFLKFNEQLNKKCLFTCLSLKDLTSLKDSDKEFLDDSNQVLGLIKDGIKTEDDVEKKMCFMDFRAEKELG